MIKCGDCGEEAGWRFKIRAIWGWAVHPVCTRHLNKMVGYWAGRRDIEIEAV